MTKTQLVQQEMMKALKERQTELIFQLGYGVAKAWLGYTQFLSCPGIVSGIRQFHEITQVK